MSQFQPIPGVLVLGLGHKARHGKDSCAAAMVASDPLNVMRFGFADALYDYCRIEHGMTDKDPALLQRVGVQMREERDPLIWINAVYQKIRDKRPRVAVVSDVRFQNEADFIKAVGGYTIKIDRRLPVDRLQGIERGPDRVAERTRLHDAPFQSPDRDPNHVSEIELDGYSWDLTITNRELATTLANAVQALKYFRGLHEQGVTRA